MPKREWTCYQQRNENLWSVRSENNERIAFDLEEECAKELVRRWNNHDALLTAAKAFVRWVDDCWGASELIHPNTKAEYEAAKKAIADAEEQDAQPDAG